MSYQSADCCHGADYVAGQTAPSVESYSFSEGVQELADSNFLDTVLRSVFAVSAPDSDLP